MKRIFPAAAMAILMSATYSGAYAHPGSTILTAGNADNRSAMTDGMSYEDINGVHIFRGSPVERRALATAASELAYGGKRIMVVAKKKKWRSLRSLRTQGFYSGSGPKSRQFTQGFYSGR